MNVVETYRRLDGTQQYEIVIDNPSYPDPFQSGPVRNTIRFGSRVRPASGDAIQPGRDGFHLNGRF